MMNVRLIHVDLSKHSHPMPELAPSAEAESSLALNLLFESKLCAGKQAYGNVGLADRSKTARKHFGEPCGYEFVTDPRGPGRDEL